VNSAISLDDFILEMMRRDTRFPQFVDLFSRLELRDDLIHEHMHFSDHAYARHLICRTLRFDMPALCRRPGIQSTIHDLAGSLTTDVDIRDAA